MDRITHQSPRQRGYGSTSTPRNDSLKHTRKHGRRREDRTKEQSCQALADRPARRGGLSARATRTIRQRTADCLHGYGGPSGLGRGLSVKANRTSSSEPRKTDRPWGAHGLTARHPRTVRPLLRTVRNHFQPKLETKMDRNRSRARTRRTREEHCSRGPSARPSRTVRQARTELKTARPRKSTLPIHHRISQTVDAVETRVWGHEKHQPRMLYPKNFVS
jgi:hypothetical protein